MSTSWNFAMPITELPTRTTIPPKVNTQINGTNNSNSSWFWIAIIILVIILLIIFLGLLYYIQSKKTMPKYLNSKYIKNF